MASAQRAFDGNWSVLIVTQNGNCDRAYRYGVSIRNGGVHYDGGVVNLHRPRCGQRRGHACASSSGSAFANGSGRLNRNEGQGRWSGQSGGSRCSGYWTAERR